MRKGLAWDGCEWRMLEDRWTASILRMSNMEILPHLETKIGLALYQDLARSSGSRPALHLSISGSRGSFDGEVALLGAVWVFAYA